MNPHTATADSETMPFFLRLFPFLRATSRERPIRLSLAGESTSGRPLFPWIRLRNRHFSPRDPRNWMPSYVTRPDSTEKSTLVRVICHHYTDLDASDQRFLFFQIRAYFLRESPIYIYSNFESIPLLSPQKNSSNNVPFFDENTFLG